MIARLVAVNFQSLERAAVDFHPRFTVLVGANGSGKSAILRGLDVVCGATWPTIRNVRVPQDWTGFNDEKELLLRVRIEPPLESKGTAGKAHPVLGLQVSCRPYKVRTKRALPGDPNFDFRPYGEGGKEIMVCTQAPAKGKTPAFGPLTAVPSELRDQARVLFIDHRRSLFQHQPWSQAPC